MSESIEMKMDKNEAIVISQGLDLLVKTNGINTDENVFLVSRNFLKRLNDAWNELQKQDVQQCEVGGKCGVEGKKKPSSKANAQKK